MPLNGKHILLGVSGGIAAYKTAFLVRDFVKAGAEVQVVMTEAATHFITPLTLGTLSRREVITDMFPHAAAEATSQWTAHIDLALWADIMLVAPATANTLAKIAHGFADNFLTTLVLALRCPLAVAPSMDVDMYRNTATQQNLAALRERGVQVLEPESGELASGLVGPGRLPEPDMILHWVEGLLVEGRTDLQGKKILVTAGPTHEPIDPVRYVGNRSSGKMGFALATMAARRGAEVTLISGPVHLPTPVGVRRIDIITAREMARAVEKEFPATDALIMTAAVSDFTPVHPAGEKIKREAISGDRMTLEMEKNPDILRGAGERKARQVLVGFALETSNGLQNARQKLAAKHLDAVVLNDPTVEGAGFGTDTNVVTIVMADGREDRLPQMSKLAVAEEILNRVSPLLR
jgi:phosphopantothenoylcysteine decarboxylase / phosphopantothenate---cysteine ligase